MITTAKEIIRIIILIALNRDRSIHTITIDEITNAATRIIKIVLCRTLT